MCNVSGVLSWRLNGGSGVLPFEVALSFPGHTNNGSNIVIVNATNNTQYTCVSVKVGGMFTDSDPVVLYVAGMYVISSVFV